MVLYAWNSELTCENNLDISTYNLKKNTYVTSVMKSESN